MILAQIVLEWSTIGIISTIVFSLVSGVVSLSTSHLKAFLKTALLEQNELLMTKVREEFIRKELVDEKLKTLEARIQTLDVRLELATRGS